VFDSVNRFFATMHLGSMRTTYPYRPGPTLTCFALLVAAVACTTKDNLLYERDGSALAAGSGGGGNQGGTTGTGESLGGAGGVPVGTGGSLIRIGSGGATETTGGGGGVGGKADGSTGDGGGGVGPGSGGSAPDAVIRGTGGVGADAATDAPQTNGNDSGVGTGGVPSTGGVPGNDLGSASADGKALSCSPIPGPCSKLQTNGSLTNTTTFLYNDKGQLIREEIKGTPQPDTWYYAYDQAGNQTDRKNEGCVQGLPGRCSWYTDTYDQQGRLIESSDVKCTTDMPAGQGCWRLEYDAKGLLTKTYYLAWCEEGHPSKVTTYDYDSTGRRTAGHGYDATLLGAAGVDVTYQYDSGNQLVLERAADKQGATTGSISYTRRSDGKTLTMEYRFVATPEDDYRLIYTYDDKGNKLTQKLLSLGGTNAGKESQCYTMTYDSCGNTLTELASYDCTDSGCMSTYSYACFGG
jgi:hypothetical protein